LKGDWWQIVGLEVKGAGNNGFRVTGSHNVIENCVAHDCQDSGFQISEPGSDILILKCDSFHNYDPPTSGPHLPYIAPWGVHNEPIPKQLQVHNLEDGGVAVQYNCATPCPELVEKLAAIVKRYDKQVLLAPYPGMKSRIALTAWTRLDAFEEFDEGRIVNFVGRYRGIDHHKR
jgi:hypothetical protein